MTIISRILIFSFIFLTGIVPLTVLADTTTVPFNPSNIITDQELQNWQSMNASDIQGFLESKGGYITNLTTPDTNGNILPASTIIYNAGVEHKINPKYILDVLQKEQSLVTDPKPTQQQLNGAAGYGITDGCGWKCTAYLNNKGFGKQVDASAGLMRWYYDNYMTKSFIKRAHTTYDIDGKLIAPINLATAFLYTYTPHMHGNENFWTIWKNWFGETYPNGTLLKSKNSSTVYLLFNGEKRPFANENALITRFDPQRIVVVPQSELDRYETGTKIDLPNFSILKNNNQYYLMDYQTLRPFANKNVVTQLGFNPEEIIQVTSAQLQGYNIGTTITAKMTAPLGRLVTSKETGTEYYLKDGIYHEVVDPKIATIDFPNLSIEIVQNSLIASNTPGKPLQLTDGTLFGFTGFSDIYVSENGKKRHIPDESIFKALRYSIDNVVWLNTTARFIYPDGQPIYAPQNGSVASASGINNTGNGISHSIIQITSSTTPKTTPSMPGSSDVIDTQMQRTSADKTTYTGPTYDTAIDAYVVADAQTGKIIASKNMNVVRPLASFTKVMTAYLLMKNGLNLNAVSTYDQKTEQATYHSYRLANGEKVFNKNLMDAFLISSLNTPGHILVRNIANNEQTFINQMNAQAKSWGMNSTVFKGITGERDETVSTANNYLTLFKHADNNMTINQYLHTDYYQYNEAQDLDGKPHHYDYNTNALMKETDLPFTILASKTGYLNSAGANLAMLIKDNATGKKFYIITMGNPDYTNQFITPKQLTEWALKTL